MSARRFILGPGLALAMILSAAPLASAQVGGGASTNQVGGPDCNETCGEVSDPYTGGSGFGCWYTAVGQGQGVACWYTTATCGFLQNCVPIWEANLYADEGRFDFACGGGTGSSKLAAEGPPDTRGWPMAFAVTETDESSLGKHHTKRRGA